jgi:iron complex transport system ATP-binding protein
MSRLLEVANLTVTYGGAGAGGVLAVRDVSLTFLTGEVVALIGPNGSGKSTLIKALLGALPQARGRIKWDGVPVQQWSRRHLARYVAYLAQSPVYEPGQTVIEALRLGRAPYWSMFGGLESERDEQIVNDVAARLDLTGILDRPLDAISGGQRQRVFVGRALVQEPRAILLDEPNTFLDLKHQVELMSLLRTLSRERNVGVLMASHDLNLAASGADILLLLDKGAVVAEGEPETVLDPALLTRVYGVPMERVPRPGKLPLVVPQV